MIHMTIYKKVYLIFNSAVQLSDSITNNQMNL